MARPKKQRTQKRETPVQFRPGSELGHLVATFAALHSLQLPEACRSLIALAVSAMDIRFFSLVHQMAEALDGENAFTRACVHINTALEGARRATGNPMQADPERALFIVETVRSFLRDRGLAVREEDLCFLPESVGRQEMAAATARAPHAAAGVQEGDQEEQTDWSSLGKKEPEKVRVRVQR